LDFGYFLSSLEFFSGWQEAWMALRRVGFEARFEAYTTMLAGVIGHADRVRPLKDYCTGLIGPTERKSVEPMAALTAPHRTAAQHQSLLHFIGQGNWSDQAVLSAVAREVLPAVEARGPVRAWIVDDTSFPKQGKHSVGVARQYCGQLGKIDNCQVAVSLSLASDDASLPVAFRLYLPEVWTDDRARCAKVGIPPRIRFQTKPQIALDQIRAAKAAGLPQGTVLADAAYGNDFAFRRGITEQKLAYVMAILSTASVWPPGEYPLPAPPAKTRGRPPSRLRRDAVHKPVSVKSLALSLPARAFKTVTWREGTNAPLSSRFAALRVRPAFRDNWRAEPHDPEWLLIEWPKGDAEPTKYWFSTLPQDTKLKDLVDTAKMRWHIERDYHDLKQEVGLADYEGRSWRGFHHHATLCIAAYAYLILERAALPPSGKTKTGQRQKSPLPKTPACRPIARTHRTAHNKLNRNRKIPNARGPQPKSQTMSVL
jgi:SRSO17 transposase